MDENVHKNHLEDFFKNSFEESADQADPNGWDSPSSTVWDNIDQALPPEESNDRKPLIWFLLKGSAFLLLILVSWSIFHFSKKTTTPSKESKENTSISTDLAKSPVTTNNNSSSDLSPTAESEQSSYAKDTLSIANITIDPVSEIASKNFSQKEEKKKSIKSTTTAREDKNRPSQDFILNDHTYDNKTVKNNLLVPGSEEASNSVIKRFQSNNEATKDTKGLEQLPLKWMPIVYQDSSLLQLDQASFLDESMPPRLDFPKPEKGFYLGVQAAPSQSFRKIKVTGIPVVPRALEDLEQAQFSFSAGINAGYRFPKNWSIESGLQYAQQSVQYRSRRQVRYSMNDERINDQQEFEKNYNVAFSTSSGEVNTDVALARSSSTMLQENTFIPLMVQTKQTISYASVPIIVRYQLGQKKWQLGLKAGVINRFVLDANSRIESVRTLRDGVRVVIDDRFRRSRPLENVENYHLDYTFGFGVHYKISQNLWWYAEPTFSRSITPLFEGTHFKTLPRVNALELGINYMF